MPVDYDVALAFTQEYFSSRVRELCGQHDLSFFLVEPIWVADFLGKLQDGDVRVRVLIDMASDALDPGNLYFLLAKEVQRSGGHVIDEPDLGAVMAHKARLHAMLVEHNIGVPETVVIPRGEVDSFRLTAEIKAHVGVPFVVKPGWGGGRLGVILDGRSEEDLRRSAAEAPNSDSFLIQRKVVPKALDGHVGWFRVFYVFGEILPCWWEPPANQYQLVTPLQQRLYKLRPLSRMVKRIARVSKINFFSTEIALAEDGRFLAIDYLNTECDMHPKSFWPTGVPDEVVRHVAWVLVNHAMSLAQRRRGPFHSELDKKDADWAERRKRGQLLPGE